MKKAKTKALAFPRLYVAIMSLASDGEVSVALATGKLVAVTNRVNGEKGNVGRAVAFYSGFSNGIRNLLFSQGVLLFYLCFAVNVD
jgi:hypothetical protein